MTHAEAIKVRWVDAGREPQCSPNPRYPAGVDVDASGGAEPTCAVSLPYPAKRCGLYHVECGACGARAAMTTSGRADDPRSLKLACLRRAERQ